MYCVSFFYNDGDHASYIIEDEHEAIAFLNDTLACFARDNECVVQEVAPGCYSTSDGLVVAAGITKIYE